jgi:hypothetical protein
VGSQGSRLQRALDDELDLPVGEVPGVALSPGALHRYGAVRERDALLRGIVDVVEDDPFTCSATASLPRSSLQITRNAELMRRMPWFCTLWSAVSSLENVSQSTS